MAACLGLIDVPQCRSVGLLTFVAMAAVGCNRREQHVCTEMRDGLMLAAQMSCAVMYHMCAPSLYYFCWMCHARLLLSVTSIVAMHMTISDD